MAFEGNAGSIRRMSTITAILEPDADGSLHLPLPPEMRHGKVRVTATLQPADDIPATGRGFGALKGKFWMAPDFDDPLDDFKEYME